MTNPKTELDTLLDQLDAELGALMEGFHRLDESEASREKYLALMATSAQCLAVIGEVETLLLKETHEEKEE
jgi:hypothetical protein